MKRIIAVLLAVSILCALAACSAERAQPAADAGAAQDAPGAAAAQSGAESTPEQQTPAEESAPSPAPDEAEQEQDAEPAEPKILVVYFSLANTADADVVSAATPRVDGMGATAYLAQMICDEVGGELAAVTPAADYPADYNGTLSAAKDERDSDARPAFLELDVDPEDYDVIFIGYPMWWYTLPMLFYTFFDTYDLSGKTLVPFNTHAGSRDGGTYAQIAALEPDATVLDGLAVAGEKVGADTRDAVSKWLSGLNG